MLKHSAPHKPKANFAERANQSLKRKLNSFLRQEEQKGNKFLCDICQVTFKNVDALKEHLDNILIHIWKKPRALQNKLLGIFWIKNIT